MNSNRNDADAAREAKLIYRAVFQCDPPALVVERFMGVSERLDAVSPAADVRQYYQALEECRDLEALEVAARYRGRMPLLTRKIQVMVYLAETVPENQRHFVSLERSRLGAVSALTGGGVRTALKLVRGLFLLARFGDG